MGDIPKEVVLYVFRPETQYTCNKCIAFNEPSTCSYFGPKDPIKPYGSCGLFVHGENGLVPVNGLITKEQAGYDENKQGFSCKRCEYFDPSDRDCEKVDKDSDGDTPGQIHPNACCNHWEADSQRHLLVNLKIT